MARKLTKTSLVVAPLLAATFIAPVAHANEHMGRAGHSSNSMSSGSDRVISGGVGMTARDHMSQRAEDYELKLVFAATPSGDYLAEIPVTIKDRNGNTVVNAVSEGPWMFVDLPTGMYTVQAQYDGRTETRRVAVTSGSQRIVYVRFPHETRPMNVSSSR